MIFSKRLLPFVLLFVFLGSIGLVAVDTPPADVLKAAQKGICDFRAAETSRADAGQNQASLKMVENGEIQNGFQVYTISPNHLVKKGDFGEILTPTGLWRFVVTNDGTPISLITVAAVQGQWRAVSLGGAGLAAEVHKAMQTWPAKDGYTYRFLRIYQTRTDMLQIFREGKPMGFVPLTSSRQAFQLEGAYDPAVILPAGEIGQMVRKLVMEKIPEPGTVE